MQRNAEALTEMLNSGFSNEPPHPHSGVERSDGRASPVPLRGGVRGGSPKLNVEVQGHTDLALGGLKFSGNAQRRKRTHLLFHGAILLNLDLELLDAVLPMPSLQPDYRRGRSHKDFLTQLGVPAEPVKQALRNAWSANEAASLDQQYPEWRGSVEKLTAEKYSKPEWNLRA